MKRSILLSSVAAWCCVGPLSQSFAAPPAADVKTDSAARPAEVCLTDIRAFSQQMQKDGYWLGGSVYGYGYPLDGYG
jgi:hypothetical protein